MNRLERFQAQLDAYGKRHQPQFDWQRPVTGPGRHTTSEKERRLDTATQQKTADLAARQQAMPWEEVPLSSTGVNIWNTPNAYNNTPRAPQDALRQQLKDSLAQSQPGVEDPLIQVQRVAEGTPDQNNLYPFANYRDTEGADLNSLISSPTRQGSFEEDAHRRQQKIDAARAQLRGEDFTPSEYVPEDDPENRYNKNAHLDNPGDRHYATSRKELWNIYQNRGDTLYSGETANRHANRPKDGDNLQTEHVYPMSWVRAKMNAESGETKDRKQWQETSAEFNEIESDMHNLFPARAGNNKIRNSMLQGYVEGDNYFDDAKTIKIDTKNQVIEPREEARGKVARATLYMADKYGLNLPEEQKVQMTKWNEDYPPDEEEKLRNILIGQKQGNLNPFIEDMSQDELSTALKNPENRFAVNLSKGNVQSSGQDRLAAIRPGGDPLTDFGLALGKNVVGLGETAYGLTAMGVDALTTPISALSEGLGGPRIPGVEETLQIGHNFENARKWLTGLQSAGTQKAIQNAEAAGIDYDTAQEERIAAAKEAGTYGNGDAVLDWFKKAGNSAVNLIQEPLAAMDTVGSSLLYFIPVAAAGRAGKIAMEAKVLAKASTPKAAARYLESKAGKEAAKKLAGRIGYTSVGALEAGSNYISTRAQIMDMPEATLLENSEQYRSYLDEGISKEEARNRVADRGAYISSALTFGSAAAISKVSGAGKVEAQIGSKAGRASLKETGQGLLSVAGREGVEEFGQGGAGEASTNIGVKASADETREIGEGTAHAAGTGLVAGVGSGAALGSVVAAPGAAIDVAVEAAKGVKTGTSKAQNAKLDKKYAGDETAYEDYSKVGGEKHDPIRTVHTLNKEAASEDTTPARQEQILVRC